MFSIHSVFCVLILNQIVFAEDSPFVKIKPGELKGRYYTTRSGRKISGFLGIPYAAPPVGELRFKSPTPAEGWSETRDATKYGNSCPQKPFFGQGEDSDVTFGNEDCLFINVFTPNVSVDSYLPVMVFIHGGGFFAGSFESFAGPEYLLDKDIILVGMNYRLGALGFLSTEDDFAPGNNGLKDQVAALRWVRDNIKYFGGNPDSVTIFGESAGSISVNLHMLSPLSKGLFHAAICQSGTVHFNGVIIAPGVYKQYSKLIAEAVGCPYDSSNSLITCLRNVPAANFTNFSYDLSFQISKTSQPKLFFLPHVEGLHKDAFLIERPSEQITSVPWIMGFNSEEGAMQISLMLKDNLEKSLSNVNQNFDKIMKMSLMLNEDTETSKNFFKKIRSFYFGDKEINKDVVKDLVKLYTEHDCLPSTNKSLQHHKGPVYFYYFNFNGQHSWSRIFGNTIDLGVSHLDELLYLFPLENVIPNRTLTEDELDISQKLVELWTNFARYRTPSPKKSSTVWEPIMTSDNEYLHISNEGFVMRKNLLKRSSDFWQSLQEH